MADKSIVPELMRRLKSKQRRETASLIGIDQSSHSSNLAAPTNENGLPDVWKAIFSLHDPSVADTIVRKPLKSRSGFLYRKARVVCPENKNLREPWYIVFYTTDAFNEKLIRKRVLKEELSEFKTVNDRMSYARRAIEEINTLLFNDWHTETTQKAPEILKFDFRHFTCTRAIEYVGNLKVEVDGVRPKTLKEYMATKATVIDFLQHEKISQDFLLRNVNDVFVRKYFDYLKQVRGSANKTYNARRAILHSVFAALLKRDPKLFHGINPIAAVKFLKTETKKHTAYTDDQMKKIRDAIVKGNEPHLLFFIQFMYYSLSRPEELRNLKVGDIFFDDRKILFRAEISKTTIEQYIGINESLAAVIQASGILTYPPSFFVFSNAGGKHEPGQGRVSQNYFYRHIKPYISALGFYRTNANYTLYSFKHTGVIALYKATKDIKLVQSQCRHQVLEQTNTYLRDLGVVDDFEQLNKWKGPL
ncbi:MAG: tyrosine-type recombinase/integrase [Shewanella sp.]